MSALTVSVLGSRPSRRAVATILVVCLVLSLATYTFRQPASMSIDQSPSTWTTKTGTISVPLRIMPLGDSITDGDRSSTGNGYRLYLLDELHARGTKEAHNIGSLRGGDMQNNEHEGYSGRSINQIAASLKERGALSQQPNVVLLHAGTNDMINDPPIDLDPYETGPDRLKALMDDVLTVCPNTTLIVAQIILSTAWWLSPTPERIPTFNAAIPALVAKLVADGFKVLLVDMSSIDGTHDELADGLHPNDAGYKLMAGMWADALNEADRRGWIARPLVVDNVQ